VEKHAVHGVRHHPHGSSVTVTGRGHHAIWRPNKFKIWLFQPPWRGSGQSMQRISPASNTAQSRISSASFLIVIKVPNPSSSPRRVVP